MALDNLEAEAESVIRKIEELEEEHGGDDGLLEDARNEKGKITKASLKKRLKEIGDLFDDGNYSGGRFRRQKIG
jgi:type I restriction enzyme M protein